jgi:hypothetical protein
MAPAKTVKALTGYMKHMKECLAKIKADKPDIKHMDAFKLASKWKENPANPNTGESWQECQSAPKSAPSGVRKTVTGAAPVKKKAPVKKTVKKKAPVKKRLLKVDFMRVTT